MTEEVKNTIVKGIWIGIIWLVLEIIAGFIHLWIMGKKKSKCPYMQ